jgi:hypothetical protein
LTDPNEKLLKSRETENPRAQNLSFTLGPNPQNIIMSGLISLYKRKCKLFIFLA